MLDALPKALFSVLAGSDLLKKAASRYGLRTPRSFARRFIAGESVGDAIRAAREVEALRLQVTLDFLGESVTSRDAANAATQFYVAMLEQIEAAGVGRNISLKLTQLGLDIDKATSVDNLRRILDAADKRGFFVRIDMENSPYTTPTLDIFETVWSIGYHNVGVVIQSCLKRAEADVRRVMALGGRVRLVKGAYREPGDVALQQKSDVDAAFINLMKLLMVEGHYPAIATHDPAMIDATRAFARAQSIAASRYEFQMLYGIRRDLQETLTADGETVRIYVPFGKEWFPYFMRRLGERPANVGFVLRGILGERARPALKRV